ncbi:hypothetical protein BGZ73_002712 [Actinomortierella ambigua]|nr:hypothetical protein BGZ73_002712 [Actinomortierella ambigua]
MMLMKFLTLLVALLFVSAAQAACQQGCRRDGHFKDAQVYAKMRSTHRYGGILTARIDWTFRHLQTNYEGKISYWANLFEETKTHCSSDAIASSALADVTFNVIGFPEDESNTYAVEINKKFYPLETTASTFPLWSANVAGVSASSGYRYVQLSKKKLYDDVLPEPSPAFDSSQIATIHITVDPNDYTKMLENPMDVNLKAVNAGFKFINADTTYSADQVRFKTSGHGSRKYQKVSLSIAFDTTKGDTFFNRPYIKLRAEYPDPSMMRERMYVDILNSIGVPSYQATYVRVYVNGEPHGFYLMVEDIDEPYFMNTIHHGNVTNKSGLGSLFKMRSGLHATMVYKGKRSADYNPVVYENKILGNNPKEEPMKQFITFMKTLRDWDPNSAGGIDFWKQRFDLESFLRAMALEYLTGAWDSFWWRGNNYFMYFNPERNIWQFIPTDFDNTFSTANHDDVDTTYRNFARFRLREKKNDCPLVTKLIYGNKDINKLFEEILLTITQGVFNNKALDARIDTYRHQIEKEVAWDHSIDRSKRPGIDRHWDMEDFRRGIEGSGSLDEVPNGLKTWIAKRAKTVPKQLRQ